MSISYIHWSLPPTTALCNGVCIWLHFCQSTFCFWKMCLTSYYIHSIVSWVRLRPDTVYFIQYSEIKLWWLVSLLFLGSVTSLVCLADRNPWLRVVFGAICTSICAITSDWGNNWNFSAMTSLNVNNLFPFFHTKFEPDEVLCMWQQVHHEITHRMHAKYMYFYK